MIDHQLAADHREAAAITRFDNKRRLDELINVRMHGLRRAHADRNYGWLSRCSAKVHRAAMIGELWQAERNGDVASADELAHSLRRSHGR